jgi:LysR family glycine cleavage system transcriptional activator
MASMHIVHGKRTQSRLPPLTPLHTFVVTAKFLSFTAAAEYLCLTQGSVSRQIASLEDALGFILFERHSKGLTLSAKGEALLPGMQQAFELIKDNIENVSHINNTIKIHASTCIMPWLMPKLVSFRRHYPNLEVEITTSVRHSFDLDDQPYDAAITYEQLSEESTHNVLLFREELTPICQPEVFRELYDAKRPLNENLQKFSWLHATENRSDWLLWLAAAGGEQWQPQEHQHFPTLDLTMTGAAQGLGMAMGDKTLIIDDLEKGRLLAPFPLTVSTGAGYLFNYHEKSVHNADLSLFVKWLMAPGI